MGYRKHVRILVAAMLAALLAGAIVWPVGAGAVQSVHPGCSAFCRQASGAGVAPGAIKPPSYLQSLQSTVTALNNVAPIAVRCVRQQPCQGALVLFPAGVSGAPELGRVDLGVPAGQAQTVEVTLTPQALAYLQSHPQLQVDAAAFFQGTQHRDDLLITLVYQPTTASAAAANASSQPAPAGTASTNQGAPGAGAGAGQGSQPAVSRPGCGQYCQSAGGFGSGGGKPPPPSIDLLDKQLQLTNRQVSFRLACLLDQACTGALLLVADFPHTNKLPQELGRSDLFVPAHTTWLIEFRLTARGAAIVRAHHQVSAFITAVVKKGPRDVNLQGYDVTVRAGGAGHTGRRTAGGYGQDRTATSATRPSTPSTMATPIRQSGGRRMIVRAAPQSRHHS